MTPAGRTLSLFHPDAAASGAPPRPACEPASAPSAVTRRQRDAEYDRLVLANLNRLRGAFPGSTIARPDDDSC